MRDHLTTTTTLTWNTRNLLTVKTACIDHEPTVALVPLPTVGAMLGDRMGARAVMAMVVRAAALAGTVAPAVDVGVVATAIVTDDR